MKSLIAGLALMLAVDGQAAEPGKRHYSIDERVRSTTELLLEMDKLKADVYASFYGTKSVLIAERKNTLPEDEKVTYLYINETGHLDIGFTWILRYEYGLELKRVLVPKDKIEGSKLEEMMQQLADGESKKIMDNWDSFHMIWADNICDDIRQKIYKVQRRTSRNYREIKENSIKTDSGFIIASDEKLEAQLKEDDLYLNKLMDEIANKFLKKQD